MKDMFPKSLHTDVHTTLFLTAKKRKQLKCMSADEWIREMWEIHTTEHYAARKRNKALIQSTWMDTEAWHHKQLADARMVWDCSHVAGGTGSAPGSEQVSGC